jgi:hypothetical protein
MRRCWRCLATRPRPSVAQLPHDWPGLIAKPAELKTIAELVASRRELAKHNDLMPIRLTLPLAVLVDIRLINGDCEIAYW